MNQYLQEVLGEDTVMSNISDNQQVIITTTIADTNPCQLHLMTSYGEARDGQPGPVIFRMIHNIDGAMIYKESFHIILKYSMIST